MLVSTTPLETTRLIAKQYSFTSVKRMEPLLDAHIDHWLQKIDERYARTGAGFDFSWWAV